METKNSIYGLNKQQVNVFIYLSTIYFFLVLKVLGKPKQIGFPDFLSAHSSHVFDLN